LTIGCLRPSNRAGTEVVALAQCTVDGEADNATEEHYKGIHHPLNQRHGDHVAVGNARNGTDGSISAF
jgi:hypothetical protein